MKFTKNEINIATRMIGPMSKSNIEVLENKIDSFLHEQVSLFLPATGQCEYAITPDHFHPTYSFVYYFQSIPDFVVEGTHKSYDLVDGACLSAMSPNVLHQELPQDSFQSYIAILIDRKVFEDAYLQYAKVIPVFKGENVVPHPELVSILRCFMLECRGAKNDNLLKDQLATLLVHYTVRSLVKEENETIPLYDRFEVDKAIAYMNSHFSKKLSMEEVADWVNLSVGHFSRIFKTVTGVAPNEFLMELRLQKARKMLLSSAMTVTEVAIECGFTSSSYFATCFLEKYNMSPSKYRQVMKTVNTRRD